MKTIKEILKEDEEIKYDEIAPFIVNKPVINPFKDREYKGEVTEEIIEKLKRWSFVRDSANRSAEFSVREAVWKAVEGSVWEEVGQEVGDYVRDAVGEDLWHSVWCSVSDFIYAYILSFFSLKKEDWKYCGFEFEGNPFQSCIDLWEMGIVSSFDGKVWRLHSGKDAKVIFEINKEEL